MKGIETDEPGVVVSIPCALCDGEAPSPDCSACGGHGMILLRVAPEHAAWSAEALRAHYLR